MRVLYSLLQMIPNKSLLSDTDSALEYHVRVNSVKSECLFVPFDWD